MRARTPITTLLFIFAFSAPLFAHAEGDLYNNPTPRDPATIETLYAGQIGFTATTSGSVGSYRMWFFHRDGDSTNPAAITCRVFYNQFNDNVIHYSGNVFPATDLTQTFTGTIPPYAEATYHWGEVDGTWGETDPCRFKVGDRIIVGLTPFGDPYWLGDNVAGVLSSPPPPVLYESTTTQSGNVYQHSISPHFPRPSTVQQSPYGTNGEFFFTNTLGTTTLTSVSEFLLWTGSRYFSPAPTELTPTLVEYRQGTPAGAPLCTGTPIDVSDPSKVFSYYTRASDEFTGYNLTFDHYEDGFYYGTVPLHFPNCTIPLSSSGNFYSIALPYTAGGSGGQLGTLRDPSIIPPEGSQGDYRWNVEASVDGVLATPTPLTGPSNVLFLPGIETSRLYEGTACGKTAEEKLWEPLADGIIKILRGAGDDKVRELFLNSAGESKCSDIYAKADDIIGSVGGSNIYKSFIDEMNGLKADGTIADWKSAAYDWRLSLNNLLTRGTERNGKIYYEEATSTPYIEQTLRALAATSKSGKVTIVTHSNGGLVAKALLNKLGSAASQLVDKVIMVAAPQTGAPIAMGALLFGQDQGISSYTIPILHNDVAQGLALNSPMAYHLLPSEDYLESVAPDFAHRVASFAGDAYTHEISSYGSTIGNLGDLDSFLLASTSLNPGLINYANAQHATLDFWTPPAGIEVDQIAGWGNDTVSGIDFYTLPSDVGVAASAGPQGEYRPVLTEDGDGTVPTPSALEMASSTNVKRYWLNLDSYFRTTSIKRAHKDILEIPSLEDFIKNVIKNSPVTLPTYISSNQPAPITDSKKLTIFLHSPLTLQLQDSSGHVTGLALDNSVTEDIPGSSYGEFGEVKYVTVPEGRAYQLILHGQATGTFSLDTEETSGGVITASSTIAGVPTTASTTVSMNIQSDISTLSPMSVDENGDGTIDVTITPKLGGIVVFDTTPPELQITFSTSTNALAFIGTDDSGPSTVTSTTTYPALKKGQKDPKGTATTTVTARDATGNTTKLIYTEQLPSPVQRDVIMPQALVYNGATTTLASASLSYKWRVNKDGSYNVFATNLHTASTALESHWRPKKKTTLIMTKPQDLDDSDSDDASDMRPTKQMLPGMVIPYIQTKKGSLIISY